MDASEPCHLYDTTDQHNKQQAFSSTWFFLRTRTPRPPAAPFHMAANVTPASMRQCSLFPLPKQLCRWYSCLGLRVEQASTVPRLWSETGWERLWMQTVSYLPWWMTIRTGTERQVRWRTSGYDAHLGRFALGAWQCISPSFCWHYQTVSSKACSCN